MEFDSLVSIFELSGWQALGKIPSPLSGKAEVNLEAARNTIEILALLKEKTSGNLEPGEESRLAAVIANLQLNFASVKAEEARGGGETKGEEETDGEESRAERAEGGSPEKEDPDPGEGERPG